MGKYLKMSDVFVGDVGFDFEGDIFDNDAVFGTIDMDKCEAVGLAINSHDELVESMRHYKQEAEQWEVRAAKEASRAQDLEAEVERLRDALQDAYLDGCHYGWEMSAEGYNAEHGGPNDGRLHNQFIESYSGEPYISE